MESATSSAPASPRTAQPGTSTAGALTVGHPFRWSAADKTELPVALEGRLPAWLKGQLVRTAPAAFQRGPHAVQHWFDAHGLIYGFELGEQPRFKQRLLSSRALADAEGGGSAVASFGTDTRRSLWRRLVQPIPTITDNANVNVVPWQGKWLAMTESPHQHIIDPESLATEGLYSYGDKLPRSMSMSAHPHHDAALGALVNVGVSLGPSSELLVYRQNTRGRERVVEGRLRFKRPPYVHSFGLTANYALLIDHPLTVNPLKMLVTNRAFYHHFAWQPERGTRLWKLDRRTGAFSAYETEPLFCFHMVNTFEQGDELVFDFMAFDDASIVAALALPQLLSAPPLISTRLVRARLLPGKKQVQLETLSDARFEFPQINYRTHSGKPYRTVWGARIGDAVAGPWASEIVKVGVESGQLLRHQDDFTYGEPVFVPRPGASAEDDGVLLAVGSHPERELSRLCVLDASTLAPLASLSVPLSLPLGFHGNFQAR